MEVTVPSGTPFKPGDVVIAFYDGFVLYVAKGTQVDETLLRRAISVGTEAMRIEESIRKALPDTREGRGA